MFTLVSDTTDRTETTANPLHWPLHLLTMGGSAGSRANDAERHQPGTVATRGKLGTAANAGDPDPRARLRYWLAR